jgi:hypothetical protein
MLSSNTPSARVKIRIVSSSEEQNLVLSNLLMSSPIMSRGVPTPHCCILLARGASIFFLLR